MRNRNHLRNGQQKLRWNLRWAAHLRRQPSLSTKFHFAKPRAEARDSRFHRCPPLTHPPTPPPAKSREHAVPTPPHPTPCRRPNKVHRASRTSTGPKGRLRCLQCVRSLARISPFPRPHLSEPLALAPGATRRRGESGSRDRPRTQRRPVDRRISADGARAQMNSAEAANEEAAAEGGRRRCELEKIQEDSRSSTG
jgi:hypothetical protein